MRCRLMGLLSRWIGIARSLRLRNEVILGQDGPTVAIDRLSSAAHQHFVIGLVLFLSAITAGTGLCDANDPFTIVIIPDTQIYCLNDPAWRNSSRKEIFLQMTAWIASNVRRENIVFALHMGDVVTTHDSPAEWAIADQAMSQLDGKVPYCFTVGNHDLAIGGDNNRDSSYFNKTFPYQRYENEPWFGGRLADDGFLPHDNYDNCYHQFSAGGMDFLIVSLEVGPTDKMLAWADSVIARHPARHVILITHSYMDGHDQRDPPGGYGYLPPGEANTGEEIWQKLVRKHEQISFVLNGHLANRENHRGFLTSRGDQDNVVYQLLSGEDYDGWLRLLVFEPDKKRVVVRSYSPWRPADASQQFKQYPFDLPGFNPDEFHQYKLPYCMAPTSSPR